MAVRVFLSLLARLRYGWIPRGGGGYACGVVCSVRRGLGAGLALVLFASLLAAVPAGLPLGLGASEASAQQVTSQAVLNRVTIVEGQTREFLISNVTQRSRYYVHVSVVGSFTAEAGDVRVTTDNLLGQAQVITPDSDAPRAYRNATHGTVSFEVAALADGDGDDETFGVRLCTTADCVGGTVLGEWSVAVAEPAADTVLSGTGTTVTIPGGSALSVMEATRNRDSSDTRAGFKIALDAAPTEDIVIVGRVDATAANGDGFATSIARIAGPPSPDEQTTLVSGYVVASFPSVVTEVHPGDPTANPPVAPSTTTRAPTPAELAVDVALVAFDNAVDTPGGTLMGNLTFAVYKDNDRFRTPGTPGKDGDFGNAEVYTAISLPSVPVRVTDDDEPTRVRLLPNSPADNTATEGGADKATVLVKLDRSLAAGEEVTAVLTFAGATLGANFSLAAAGGQTGVTYADSQDGTKGLVTLAGVGVQEGVVEVTALVDGDSVSQTLQIGMPPTDEPLRANYLRSNLAGGVCAAHGCPNRPQGDPGERFQSVTLAEAVPGLTVVDSGDGRVDENGGTYSYKVRLNTAPAAAVTVAVTSSDVTKAAVTAGASLTFTPSGAGIWSTPQTVTVTGADNNTDAADAAVTISHAISSSDSSYSGLAAVAHELTVADDDATTVTMAGTGVRDPGDHSTGTNISRVMVEGDPLRVDRTLTISLGRALVAGEHVRVPLRVEAVANGNNPQLPEDPPGRDDDDDPQLPSDYDPLRTTVDSYRGPRASANVAWPPHHNDVVMTATGTGVTYEHSNRNTPNHIGYRYIEFRGAGAQTATIEVHARGDFDDGEHYDEAFAVTFPNDFYVFDSDTEQPFSSTPVQGNLGGGVEASPAGGEAWFAIADDDEAAAAATIQVANNWSLKPLGLNDGARFRLLYVTRGTRNASEDGWDPYNSFVREEITGSQLKQGGVPDLQPYASKFKAVISVNGGGNASLNANLEAAGSDAPIYWVGGTKVADNKADFLDGTWDDETNPTHADGTAATLSANGYWTGSEADAWRSDDCDGLTGSDRHLRAGAPNVSYGLLNDNSRGPLGQPAGTTNCQPAPSAEQRPLYALSTEEFTIPGGAAIESATAAEGSPVTFGVTITTAAPAGGITIPYTLADGRGYSDDPAHAIATSTDYTDAASGSITIAQGHTAGTITVNTTGDSIYESDHYFTVTLGTPTGTDAPSVTALKGTAVGTITDDADKPTIQFNSTTATAAEDDGATTLTVTKTGTTLLPASVYWTTADGTGASGAAHPGDYTADAGYLEFAAGDTSKTITVDITADSVSESAETFTVGLGDPADATLGSASTATVTVTDADTGALPTVDVTLSASDGNSDGDPVEGGSGAEGYKTITITLSRALASGQWMVLPLTVQGATVTDDYTFDLEPAPQTGVTVIGDSTQNPSVQMVGNNIQTVTLRLTPVQNAVRSQPAVSISTGTPTVNGITAGEVSGGPIVFSIVDDESGVIRVASETFGLAPSGLSAGDRFRLIFVTSETRTAESADIDDYNTWVQGVVARGGHAGLLPYGGLVRVIGATAAVEAREQTGMWDPSLNSGSGGWTDGSTSDSDSGVAVYWLAAPSSDKVADNYFDFFDDTWDGGLDQSQEATNEAGAGRGSTGIWTGTFTNGRNTVQGVTIEGLGHSGSEVGSGHTNAAGNNSLYEGSTSKTNTLPMFGISPVFELMALPELSFNAATYSVAENVSAGTVSIQVNASPAPTSNLTVNLRSGDVTATSVDDYTPPTASFTFPSGQTSHTFTVPIIDDNTAEGAETFTLTLAAGSGYSLGSPATTTVTITDDDATPVTVTMSASDGDANGNAVENGAGTTGYRTITITLGRALTGAETVTVPLTVQGATVADDYTFGLHPATQTGVTLLNSGTTHTAQNPALRFVSGGTSATLRLRPVNDSDREQPYAVVAYGTDARAPSGANVTLGDVTGGPIGIVLVDDETGAVKVPSSWGLVPSSGVGPGDDFRLLFRTSTGRDATSTDIADYDAFIREVLATGGHADILPYAGFFKVFGSTRSSSGSTGTAARVHNGMTAAHTGHNPTWADGSGTDSDAAGTPTYWLNGARLANNYRDLCDQAWSGSGTGVLNGFDRDDPRSEDGTRNVPAGTISDFMPYEPWTGSGNACEAWNHPLGASTVSRGGADSGASLWHANAQANTQTRPLYGMSPVFSVEGAAAELSVSASGTVTEGGTLTVTVTLNTSADANLSIPVRMRTSGAPTASSADFTLSNGGSVAISSGSSSGTLTFNATDDRIDEDAETLVLEFGVLPAGVVAGSADSVAVTINDNDTAAVTVTPSGGTTTVSEDQSDTDDYTVVLGSRPLSNVTITATAPAGTQVSDDGGSTWGSSVDLEFTAGTSGNWGTAQTVTVRGTQDIIDNPGDQRSVTITHAITSGNGDGSRYTPTAPSKPGVAVTVTDDDEAPKVITLGVDDSTVGEGDGATTITVTATVVGVTRFGVAQEVNVTVAATADGNINYVDMAPVSTFTITIPAGAQSATGMFTLTPDNDIVDETDNTVMVTGSIMGTSTPGIAGAQITLTDDDATPTSVTLSVNPTSITENGGARTVTVTATVNGGTRLGNTVTVGVDVDGYNSQGRVNFSQVASFNISIVRGAASGSGSFTLTPTNNNWDEQNGAAALSGTSLGLTVNGASVTITDDDAAPTGVALSVDESTIAEGAGATAVTVTATVQGSTRYGSDRTVTVSHAGSGNADAVDYTATAPAAITIPAGQASRTTTFTLTPTDDAMDEFNETVTVSGSGAGVASFSSASITLTDNDDTTLTISAPAGGIAESGGTKDVTLTLSRALVDGETVTVPLEVVGATAGSDYTLALHPASQAGVLLSTSGSDSVQQPKVTLSTGASSAVLRFTAVDDALRQQPYLVVKYGTGGRAPSGSGIGLAAPGDDSVGFVLTDDETGVIGALPSWGLMPNAAATLRHDFRLVFVTSGMRDASSTDIADYDHFVRRHLAEGHADIVPYAGFFTALGSTSAVTLQDHASVTGGASMNFYWLGETGTTGERRVASANSNFRGEWLEGSTPSQQSVPRDESGALVAVAANGYFTGSTAAGARSANPLGSANVTVGYLNDGGAGRAPLGSGQTASRTATRSFYGLSPVFSYLSDPAISITSATATVTEGTSITFTIEADPAPAANLPVNLAVGDSGHVIPPAASGLKYSAVTIPANTASVTYTVNTVADTTDEPDTDVTVGIFGGSDYVLGLPHTSVVTVIDNDAMAVSVSGGSGTVSEGASLDYTVDPGRELETGETVTVNFAPAGTATQGSDYSITCHGAGVSCTGLNGAAPALKITGGSGVRRGTIRVSVQTDSVHPETGETAGISLRAGHSSTGSGGAFSVTGTPSTFTISSVAPVGDGVEVPANWALIPSGLSGGDSFRLLFVSSTKRDASSTDIADYNSFVQARAAAGHAALASHSSAFRAVASTAAVDARDNTSTTGTGVPVYWVSGQKVADDYADFYDASWDSCVARDESGGSVALPNLDANLANAIWTGTNHDGTAETTRALGTTMPRVAILTESCDSRYSATAFPLRFQFTTGTKANTSNRYLYGLSPVFKVAGTAPAAITASFPAAAYQVQESGGGGSVSVRLSAAAPSGGLAVSYTTGGTAVSGDDYTGAGGTVTVAQGQMSANISFTVIDDKLAEGAETLTLTIADGTGYDLGATPTTTITINDNDVAPTNIALSVDDSSVGEGDGATVITVTATVQGASRFAEAKTVAVTVTGSGGANVVGFTAAPSPFSIPIATGAQTGTGMFTLTPTDNSAVENDETVTVAGTLSGTTVASATITVTDDDTAATPVTVTLSAAAGDVTEGAAGAAGRKDVTITLGRALTGSETVTVPLSVQGAAVGSDYSFGLQPASQSGVSLLTGGSHSAQDPAVRFSAGATTAVLRFSPVNNAVRTQPYVVIGYGSGARAPSGGGGATLGAVTGGPVAFVVVDDETGDVTVPSSWGLAPSGLGAGDDFRLLFRTSATRDAASSDIADYDAFVRNAAATGGHADIVAYAGFFKAFASTRSSSGTTGTTARVHNGMASGHTGHFNGANDVWADGSTVPNAGNTAGTPVWWLNGAKLANNYADLCDQAVASGSGVTTGWDIDDPRSETGSRNIAVGVTAGQAHQAWTGTGNACEAYSYPLGNSTVSRAASHDTTWAFMHEGHSARSQQRPLYAMSPVFRIAGAAAVPVADFASASSSAAESAGTRNITVSLSPAPSSSVTVAYTLSGTAVRGSDYTISGVTSNSGTVTVGPSGTAVIAVAITDDSAAESAETVVLTLGNGSGYTVGTAAPVHTLTVSDDDTAGVPVVSVSAGSAVIEGGNAVFTIAASPAATGTISVRYTVTQNGQFLASGRLGSGKQRSLSGASATISIPTESDSVDEADGSVTVTLTGATGYTVGSPSSASVTVRDNDVPAAEFAAGTSDVDEGSGTHLVRVNLSPAPHRGVTVAYTVGGTATRGTDFATAGTVSAAAGAAFVDIPVTIIGDGADEPDETVVLTLTGGAGYEVGSLSVHTVTVADGPTGPPPALSVVTVAAGPAVIEGANATFTLSASLPAAAVSVRYTVTQNGQYLASGQLGSGKAATLSGTSAAIRIPTVNDTVDEAYGSVTVTLEAGTGYTVGAPASATIAVQDEDLPIARFAARTSTAGEGASTHYVRVLFSTPPHRDVLLGHSVLFSREPGSATRGADFTVEGSSVPVRAGAAFADIPIEIVDDNIAEGPETFALRLNIGGYYFLGPNWTRSHTVTITDSGTAVTPVADFAVAASTAAESAGTRNVTVRLVPAPAQSTTVSYALSGTAVRGSDYTISGVTSNTGTVTVGVSGTATIPVAIVDDTATEGDETVVLTLTIGSGYTVGTDSPSHTLTIAANDTVVVPQVSVTAGPAVDEGTAATFAVSASPAASGTISVRYTVTQNGQFVTSGQLGSNKTRTLSGASATISIPTQNDSADEADGSVTVTLTPGSGYTVGTPSSATVTVRDDDVPTAQFAASASTAAESAGTRNVTVRLVPAPAQSTTVSYALSGTAVRGSDYTISGVTSNTGTVAVGTSGTATIPVAITDDSATESAETVVLTLTGGAGYDIGASQSHTLTITDNDTAGVPQVSVIAGPAVDEGTAATFAVSASPAASGTISVRYTVTQNGQFVTSGQLGSNKTRTLSGASATISIPTQNDSADEADGSVTVTLTPGSGYTVGTPATATVTVRDDDVPTALFATAAASVDESAGIRQVRVNLNPAPHRGITVGYTIGGSATRGTDFTAAGSVSVTAGAAFVDIPVTIIDDSSQEPDETVTLTLTGGAGYQVGSRSTHTLTITDQDVSPAAAFATAAAQASEGMGTHQVTLTVLPAPSTPITVRYTISGTATRGADYTAPSGTITVTAGATTAAIDIPITDDTANEGDETVTLTLTAPGGSAGYVLGSPAVFTLTIADDDATPATPRVSFVHESSSVSEHDAARYPSFTISPAPPAPITIHFAIDANASTATLGADYKITWTHPYTLHDNDRDGIWEGTITAPATAPAYGYWRLPTIRPVNDRTREPNETIVLRLLNGPGYTLGDISTYTITITD